MIENKGFYLQGKFDQFARNIPYSAWIEIFKDFVNQILTSEEGEIQKWRNLLVSTLGNSTGVLADLIPNLQYIIHELPSVDELGITETQNRLNDLLNKFFKSIATEEHPITVFIDDLQWADNASLNLLKTLLTDADCRYLLVIGAYRSDELSGNDPLSMKLEEIAQSAIKIEEIKLVNLSLFQVNELLSETLSVASIQTEALAEVIINKTQGNPYFTYQFINSLYDEGLVKFNWENSIELKKPDWEWNLQGINAKFISNNVVDFLVGKIIELPEEVTQTLKSAACIGNSFKLNNLATVRKTDIGVIANFLEIAINEGYIFYKNVNQIHWVKEGMDVEYQFSHDRVQQAFYSLIPESDRQQTHFEIGKLLAASLTQEQIEIQIFQLVFHLNFGVDFITDYDQAKWLAQLNLKAGKEAKKIIAFDAAYNYISIAHKLLGERVWKEDEDLAVQVGQEFLDCIYQTNRFEEAEKYFDTLIEKMSDNKQKAELHYRKMIQYQHLSKIDKILDTGLQGLALLGMKFSPKSSRFSVLVELAKTYSLMRNKSEADLKGLPVMTDTTSRIAMSLIYKSLVFAYDRSEELMAVLGMKLLQLTVTKGSHHYSMAGYSTYGGILSVGFKNHLAPLKFNKIAIDSTTKIGNKSAMAMAHFGLAMTAYAKLTFKEALEEFQTSVDLALEAGAHTDAAPSTMYFFFLNFFQGKRLNELRQIVLDNLYFTSQIKTENFHLLLLAALSVIQELKDGAEHDLLVIKGETISNKILEEKLIGTEHKSIRIYSRIFQMHNHIMYERYDDAKKTEQEILMVLNVTIGTVLGPYFNYLQAILYGRLYFKSEPKEQLRIRKIIKEATQNIAQLTVHCPTNFQHWEFLLRAEQARVNGEITAAQKWYDKAIDAARTGNYFHESALGSYLCARFNEELGNTKIALSYFSEAVNGFNAWGASALASFIANNLRLTPTAYHGANALLHTSLDQESLIKLSQLISGEIEFNKLIKKLMTVFIGNAGAEKAILILKDNDQWFIEAEQRKNEELNIQRSVLFDDKSDSISANLVSISICQFVMRTSETVIVEDAIQDNRFSKLAYVKNNNPRSILCMPLIQKGEVAGLVYLENNLMAGAFKTDRIQLLNYISSQIAVSIENAKLYSNVKNLNKSYERFVPKEFLEMLGKNSILDVKLGDQVQMNMTVLFADIRDFTGMSEKMSPAENFEFINGYLSRMEPIIRRYHGFIDKYIGDEIMALFPTNADDAIQCSIAMLHELKVYGDYLRKQNLTPIHIGIGLNTGSLMLGTVGGDDRMNSTVISDAVNLASRVEKDTKVSGAPFLITQQTYENLKDPSLYAIRKLGQKVYRGKSTATVVYEVFENDEPEVVKLKKETASDFERALVYFGNNEFQKSIALFKELLSKNPDDKPAALYLLNVQKQYIASQQQANKQDIQTQ